MDVLLPRHRCIGNQRSSSLPVELYTPDILENPAEKTSLGGHPQSPTHCQCPGEKIKHSGQSKREDVNTKSHLHDEWSYLRPDERGAELGREARVWKVYVGETEKWDKEMIEGWEKSMDVLLVFAALFSAVTAAFLIESSGMLKQDPNDISAAALLIISQAAIAIATNNASVKEPTLPKQGIIWPSDFAPSQSAIIINTLWYTSLTLSIATAFMAMLAKDWCYSFGAKRTGHPFDQAHRRQRKWELIERWKMQELIQALPFMIHLSLLLFSVGLCVYLWDLNHTVAIPIVCIAGAFLAFYLWSSLIASIEEFFPYTTIVSRILRSGSLLSLYPPIRKILSQVTFALAQLYVWAIYLYLALAYIPAGIITAVFALLMALDKYSLRIFIKSPGVLSSLIESFWSTAAFLPVLPWYFVGALCSPIHSGISHALKRLQLTQDLTTSLALSWLIKHCESRSAVDIALQAIAGAGQGFPKEPLLSCQAIVKIMQLVVSHDSSYEDDARNDRYIRGLKFLGFNSSLISVDKKYKPEEDIKVMVWDLKAKLLFENRKIADFIKDGSFVPSDNNFQAIKIGNSVAPRCLDLLTGETETTAKTLGAITQLLSGHLVSKTERLHPAALHSLAKAAALYASLLTSPKIPPNLVNLCMAYCEELAHGYYYGDSTCDFGTGVMFILCVLLHGNSSIGKHRPTGLLSKLEHRACSSRAIHMLLDTYTEDEKLQQEIFWVACFEILSNASIYGLEKGANDWETLEYWCTQRATESLTRLSPPLSQTYTWDNDERMIKISRKRFVDATTQVYGLIIVSRPLARPPHLPDSIYTILTVIACSSSPGTWEFQECNKLLAQSQLPKLSKGLVDNICAQNIAHLYTEPLCMTPLSIFVDAYARNPQSDAQRHFSAIQLWLLFRLAEQVSLINSEEKRLRLRRNLGAMIRTIPELRNKSLDRVQEEIETLIIENYRRDHSANGAVVNKNNSPQSIWDRITFRLKAWRLNTSTGSTLFQIGNCHNLEENGLPVDTEARILAVKYQREYTLRIIKLILEIRGVQGNQDLIPLMEEDCKGLSAGVRMRLNLSGLKLGPPVQSRDKPGPETTPVAEPLPVSDEPGYVAVEVHKLPNPSHSENYSCDMGLHRLFYGSSEAL
ncbi:unnamed protein product [Rhizoctonia solani]|uniref:DUF6535 domain-containing protein n=1 Tax=Rhizoctonia solani TaxID=456999 RepID=A0A8H3H3S5_9AGAM|nr:unnamed protein product [Rhizoctonia solani]